MKLTHWVRNKHVKAVLKGEEISKKDHFNSFKPDGFWISVNNGWEDWCKSEMPHWIDNTRTCLKAILSKDINLFVIESKEQFLKEFKNLTGKKYIELSIEGRKLKIVFHEKLAEKYDGIYLKLEPFLKHRLDFDFMYFYSWDCESMCIWNKDKIKFEEVGK